MPVNKKRNPIKRMEKVNVKATELRTKSKEVLREAYLLMLQLEKKTGKKIPSNLKTKKK